MNTDPLQGIILAGDSWLASDLGIVNQIQNATQKPVTNFGVGGSRSVDTLQRLNDFILNGGSFAPGSVVVLNVGGNDFLSGINRDVTKNNLDRIVSLLNSQGVKTVLSGAPSVNSIDDITSGKQLSIDPIYKDVADKYKTVTLVDSMASLLNQPNLRTPDNIHLTNSGQLQFVETLLKGIGTAQKQTAKPTATQTTPAPAPLPRPAMLNAPAEQPPAGLESVIYSQRAGLTPVAVQQEIGQPFSKEEFDRFFTTLNQPTGLPSLVEADKAAEAQSVTAQPLTSTITESGITTSKAGGGVVTNQQAQPMAFTNEQIADYIRSIQAQGGGNAQIASEMDRLLVSPAQVASATGLSTTEVQNLYNQANPQGRYSTVNTTTTTTGGTNTGTTTGGTNTGTTTGGTTSNFTPTQIADYVTEMQRLGRTEADIAAEMDRFGVNVTQMAQALKASPVVIQDLYNVARPKGRFSTVLSKEGVAGFESPTYEPVTFTGGNAPALPVTIPTIQYAARDLLSGAAPGASRGVMGLAPVAAPEPYAGVPAAPARPATNMKEGGLAGLAEKVQSAGRNGDTMLAHITPEEAGILQLMGGSGTINPQTGLPEFWNPLREIRRAGRSLESGVRSLGRSIDRRITQPIIGELNNLAERLGPIGQLAAMYFGGPIGAGIYAGFAAPGDDFNVKKAAQTAALTYAGREMFPNLGGSPSGGATPMSAADYSAAVDSIDAAAGATLTPPPPGPGAMVSSADPNVISYTPNPASYVGGAPAIEQTAMLDQPTMTDAGPGAAPSITSQVEEANKAYEAGRPFTDKAADYLSNLGSRAVDYAIDNPFKTAIAANMGASLIQGQREREKFKEEQARIQRETAERRRRYREQAEGILSLYPIRFAAQGGMMDEPDTGPEYDFAAGGMPPRFLSGGGDGMSDSIPAMIGDQQPARLADGEFVIPADVVSGLGNGSSKAGAKQLYAMMDRIRKARTGTTKQGREINPRRFMPA